MLTLVFLAISLLGVFCNAKTDNEDIRLPPEMTVTPLKENVYKAGDSVELKCAAVGIPVPEYIWMKNNKTLEITGRIEKKEGTITIKQANFYSDDGWYQCIARNKYGTALSARVRVKQAVIDYSTQTSPTVLNAEEGKPFQLNPYNKIVSFPSPLFTWKTVKTAEANDDPKVINHNARVSLDTMNGTLYFANIMMEDNKDDRIYKLDVRNSIEDLTRGGSPYQIKVLPATVVNSAPAVMVPKPDAEEVEHVGIKGNNATLMCFFSGFPTPAIEWRLPQNPPHQSRLDCSKDFNTRCEITNLEYGDEGQFICSGRNDAGRKEVKINLKIESIPTFKVKPQNLNVSEGNTAVYNCEADAKPAAKVDWFSNGILINPQEPGNSRFIVNQNKLTVTQVCKDCAGSPDTDLQVFQCRITNKHGEDYASAYLNVLSATKIYEHSPLNVVLDTKEESGMVTNFTCRPKTDSLERNELDIQWWYEKRRIYHEQGPYRLSEKNQVLEVNLKNSSKADQSRIIGEYQCIAKTKYSNASVVFSLAIMGVTKAQKSMIEELWWIFIIIFVILLIFICCICCVLHAQRNKGDEYPVDEKERLNGNDPEAELAEMDYQDFQRPIESATLRKGSRASLGSTNQLDKSTDSISMFTDPGRFDEDGSFVDRYGTAGSRRQLIVPNHSVSEA